MKLAQMVELRYNTGVNHIKSSGALTRFRYPFSTYDRGVDTMSDHTLPLFSLQEETKEIFLTKGKVAVVDASDYDRLMMHKWCAVYRGNNWYAQSTVQVGFKRRATILMHRVILGLQDRDILADHIDGNGLNNTRSNLRIANRQQNTLNRRVRKDSYPYKGVSFRADMGKWRAYINLDGKRTYLGYFVTANDAAIAYNMAAQVLHGEFARLNHINMADKK